MGLQTAMFVLGLILLVWGSSLFVDSAVTLANYLHLSEVLIGATVVSLGTTLPEILFSAMAAANGLTDMALGNALGSILCNTGLIAGLLLLLKPVSLSDPEIKNIRTGAYFLGIGLLVYTVSGIFFDGLPRLVGFLLLVLCVLYLKYGTLCRKNPQDRPASSASSKSAAIPDTKFGLSDFFRLILEAAALYTGADLLVKSGPALARSLGVPEVLISLTLVALGTSLPELVTSLVSLKKNHSSLSLGNIIGADILNFLLVGGISTVICPIPYPKSTLHLELPFARFLLFTLCIPSILQRKTGRLQALLLLSGYALYLFLLQ